jgi:hypothetical protein
MPPTALSLCFGWSSAELAASEYGQDAVAVRDWSGTLQLKG